MSDNVVSLTYCGEAASDPRDSGLSTIAIDIDKPREVGTKVPINAYQDGIFVVVGHRVWNGEAWIEKNASR